MTWDNDRETLNEGLGYAVTSERQVENGIGTHGGKAQKVLRMQYGGNGLQYGKEKAACLSKLAWR